MVLTLFSPSKMCCSISFSSAEAFCQAVWKTVPLRYLKFQAKPAWKPQPCLLFRGVLWILANRGGSCAIAWEEESIYVFDFCSSGVLKALQKKTLLTSWCVGCGIVLNLQERCLKGVCMYVRSLAAQASSISLLSSVERIWLCCTGACCTDSLQFLFHIHLIFLKIVSGDVSYVRRGWWIYIRRIFLSSSSSTHYAVQTLLKIESTGGISALSWQCRLSLVPQYSLIGLNPGTCRRKLELSMQDSFCLSF